MTFSAAIYWEYRTIEHPELYPLPRITAWLGKNDGWSYRFQGVP